MNNKIKSFSIHITDTKGNTEVEKLEAHAEKTGIKFSYLIIQAITLLNKELKL